MALVGLTKLDLKHEVKLEKLGGKKPSDIANIMEKKGGKKSSKGSANQDTSVRIAGKYCMYLSGLHERLEFLIEEGPSLEPMIIYDFRSKKYQMFNEKAFGDFKKFLGV